MKKAVIVMTLLGALVGGTVAGALSPRKELLYASQKDPTTGETLSSVKIVYEGIEFYSYGTPILIKWDEVDLLHASFTNWDK